MPPGGRIIDNGKRIVSGKRKDSERAELGRESFTEVLGFAGSVTRAWCDFKNVPEFLAVQFSSGKRYCRRFAGHGSFRRISTMRDRFLILRRFQGDLQGTIRFRRGQTVCQDRDPRASTRASRGQIATPERCVFREH